VLECIWLASACQPTGIFLEQQGLRGLDAANWAASVLYLMHMDHLLPRSSAARRVGAALVRRRRS